MYVHILDDRLLLSVSARRQPKLLLAHLVLLLSHLVADDVVGGVPDGAAAAAAADDDDDGWALDILQHLRRLFDADDALVLVPDLVVAVVDGRALPILQVVPPLLPSRLIDDGMHDYDYDYLTIPMSRPGKRRHCYGLRPS